MSEHGTAAASYGWHRDLPDHRDYHISHENVDGLIESLNFAGKKLPEKLPQKMDLREWASPAVSQGDLNACTAHATSAVVEYMQRRIYGISIDLSRLFIYKVSRSILQWDGDRGAYLRTAIGSLRLIGAPPEKYWPYDPTKLNDDPGPFCFSIGTSYRIEKQFRLDTLGVKPEETLNNIKRMAAKGLPTVFGYTVFAMANLGAGTNGGKIFLPTSTDIQVGGHAMAIFGYDDTMKITNTSTGGATTTGALLCKNSRGPDWGDAGYAWLPYDYVLHGIAVDFWGMLSVEWANLAQYQK